MVKLNCAQAHLLWMVRRPMGILVYNINRRGYNIPTCSYNGENWKNILKLQKIVCY
jgi:hypothetical protein